MKARDVDPVLSLNACREIGATDCGVLHQKDTYFDVPHGRLKLREQRGESAQLIAYHRGNETGHRESQYRLIDVGDPAALCEALSSALGIRVVVEKRRHLFKWKSVRIHLDDVSDLGLFLEFEAVAAADSDLSAERTLISTLRSTFEIADSNLVGLSYSDLLDGIAAPRSA